MRVKVIDAQCIKLNLLLSSVLEDVRLCRVVVVVSVECGGRSISRVYLFEVRIVLLVSAFRYQFGVVLRSSS